MPPPVGSSRRRRRPHRATPLGVGAALAVLLVLGPGVAAESGAPSAAVPSAPVTSVPAPSAAPASGRILRVPSDFGDIEAAIEASLPGDVILLAPGTYPGDVDVPPERPGITIRGEDRNTVVFDGGNVRTNAIDVTADGVTLENMSAHSYTANGFYWDAVEGFAGRYLTVWNVGLYGIYAIQSRGGIFEESFVSGAGDAAFYIGECFPCDSTIRHVTATLSAVGYSGTNAGGNLVVEDSRFLLNWVGILPNSYDVALEPPPQRDAVFRRNEVVGTGTVVTPRNTPLGGFGGIGIAIAGGVRNVVEGNDVRESTRYGIGVFSAVDRTTTWRPVGNHVSGNRISNSGTADLVLAGSDGGDNCFDANEAATVLPEDLDGTCSDLGDGDPDVEAEIVRSPFELQVGMPEAPHYSEMAAPPAQPTMPVVIPADTAPPASDPAPSGPVHSADPAAAPMAEAVLLGASVLVVALFAAAIVFVAFRSRATPSRD